MVKQEITMTQNESTETNKGFKEMLAAMKAVEALSTEGRIDRLRDLRMSMDNVLLGLVRSPVGLKEKRIALESSK
jgi:hypothetical protein